MLHARMRDFELADVSHRWLRKQVEVIVLFTRPWGNLIFLLTERVLAGLKDGWAPPAGLQAVLLASIVPPCFGCAVRSFPFFLLLSFPFLLFLFYSISFSAFLLSSIFYHFLSQFKKLILVLMYFLF